VILSNPLAWGFVKLLCLPGKTVKLVSRIRKLQKVFTTIFTSAFARRTALYGTAILVINLAGAHSVSAQVPRPFGGRVVAQWDNVFNALPSSIGTANFAGTSQMKHMGRSAQAGSLSLGAPTENGLPGTGTVTITAANGDKVMFRYTGFLNPFTGEGAGPIVITGGTGRFAGATGTGTFYAVINLSTPTNQSMTVLLDGIIRY
jgi:hypothetical protein